MLFVISEEVFCSTTLEQFSKVYKMLYFSVRNTNFKSPKARKSIGDTSKNLKRISMKDMVLIPISCLIFSGDCDV